MYYIQVVVALPLRSQRCSKSNSSRLNNFHALTDEQVSAIYRYLRSNTSQVVRTEIDSRECPIALENKPRDIGTDMAQERVNYTRKMVRFHIVISCRREC